MTDFDELKQTKAQCLRDITEALPDYVNRLNSIDTRLLTYIEDAISNNASHANLYELLGIRKELRLMSSYDNLLKCSGEFVKVLLDIPAEEYDNYFLYCWT